MNQSIKLDTNYEEHTVHHSVSQSLDQSRHERTVRNARSNALPVNQLIKPDGKKARKRVRGITLPVHLLINSDMKNYEEGTQQRSTSPSVDQI